MLDLKSIRGNPEILRKTIRDKQLEQRFLTGEEYRLLRRDLKEKQAKRNASSERSITSSVIVLPLPPLMTCILRLGRWSVSNLTSERMTS